MARAKKAAEKRADSRTAPKGKVVNAEFPRITVHPGRMSGHPCIRDMRITVSNVLQMLAAGHSQDEILAEFPYLERADFRDVLGYAAWLTTRRRLAPTA
jgi:uncharacterized protein (DUF433 family)